MDAENEKNVENDLAINALRGNLLNPTWNMLDLRGV